MIEILNSPDHIVVTRVTGRMSEADVQRIRAEVEARLTRNPCIASVADITGLKGATLKAMAMDVRFGMFKNRHRKRFPREAAISASPWVRAFTKVMAPLAPRVERRAFSPEEVEAAINWAGDILPKG